MDAFEIHVDTSASGRVMAHLLEPPGLGLRFESREVMRTRLPRAIATHLDWLKHHGEHVPPVRSDQYRIVTEVFVAGNFESGDDVGFYPPDAIPVTPDDIERYLRIAEHAHHDLLDLVHNASDAALRWKRDPRMRSIGEILRHVARAELWYMTRIIDDPDAGGLPEVIADTDRRSDTADPVARVRIVWAAFQHWARSLTPDMRSRVSVPSWLTERKNERWSARKMLRRCIEHCREHTRSVDQILAAHRATSRSSL